MVRSFIIGFLVSAFAAGLLWFFAGRVNYSAINETAKQIQQSNREAKFAGNSIRARYDKITGTVAGLDSRSARIKSISLTVTARSEGLAGTSGRIESGITDVKTAVDRIENRNREIVSIVGELRKVNESFYESNKGNENAN